jgi:hypothetical protein
MIHLREGTARSNLCENSAFANFRATMPPRRVSIAFQNSPILPAPMDEQKNSSCPLPLTSAMQEAANCLPPKEML